MPFKDPEKRRECSRQTSRRYYRNHPDAKEKAMARSKLARDRNRKYIKDYLSTHPCVDCGFSDVRALDFDHVRGMKSANVSKLVQATKRLEVIVAEIAKCEVRCANCHRIKTEEEYWEPLRAAGLRSPKRSETG